MNLANEKRYNLDASEKEIICRLYEMGYGVSDITKFFKKNPATIHRVLSKLGVISAKRSRPHVCDIVKNMLNNENLEKEFYMRTANLYSVEEK